LPAGAENLNTPKSTPADFPSLCFPQDRTVLAVGEVARRMRVSEQHVINLIENGRLRAVNLGASSSARWPYYRIPIEAWESYVKENLV
jgi:excisionase family DNA binding protein